MAPEPQRWDSEQLYFSGDAFYQAIIKSIDQAHATVFVECYIFADDPVGHSIWEALLRAQARGVVTRLMVDGVGSWGWIRSFRQSPPPWVRVYHPLRWGLWRLRRLNRRLHRKQIIIDSKIAFIGSFNFARVHSDEHHLDEPSWQDVAVRVEGAAVEGLESLFFKAWRKAASMSWTNSVKWITRGRFRPRRRPIGASLLFRSNDSIRTRLFWRNALLNRLRHARKRIWIANPYFVPERRMLTTLLRLPHWLKDLKILVPVRGDVWIVRVASLTLYKRLLQKGLQVFEYQPRFFHGKVMIIDDWMIIGSTNLNHRSFLHDLELDIVLTHSESKRELVRQWHQWQKDSIPVNDERLRSLSVWQWWFGRFFMLFRWWL